MGLKKDRILKGLVFFTLLAAVVLVSVNFGWCANPKVVVVASTSWTGAIAEAAGADEVRVLAPFELKHPPEYDYRPSDIAKISDATLLVYAGYEGFVKKLIGYSGVKGCYGYDGQ